MNWTLFQNSILLGTAATTLAAVLGWIAASCWLLLSGRFRLGLMAAAVTTLALPPFLVTNTWLECLGNTAPLRQWIPFSIYSLPGAVMVLGFMLWPVTFLLVCGSWQRLQVEQFEADPLLRGRFLIANLLWPVSRSAAVQAAIVTFVLALNSFSVPAILQVKVLPAEAWIRFSTALDAQGAWVLSLPLILVPAVSIALLYRADLPFPRKHAAVGPITVRRQFGRGWIILVASVTMVVLVLSLGTPLGQILGSPRTWNELPGAFRAGSSALLYSILTAAGAATGLFLLALVWRLSSRHRQKDSMATRLAGWAIWLPFFVPGVLIGLLLIRGFNQSWLGGFYQSIGIVVLAFAIRYCAIGWHAVTRSLRACDQRLLEAARLEGASGWQLFRYVYWPQASNYLAGAWYVVFVLALWDVESMILIYPPGGETLSLRIFNLLHYGYSGQVNALCLVLLVVAIIPIGVWLMGGLVRRWVVPAMCTLFLVSLAGCSPSAGILPPDSLFQDVQIISKRGVGVGEVNKPRSVSVDRSNNLFVVDMTGRVQKFSANGVFLLSWQMPESDKGRPKGLCRDNEGNIVVNEPHYSRVNYFSPEGKLLAQFSQQGTNAGQIALPRAVAVNSRGELITTEYGVTERVQRFTKHGEQLLDSFGHMGDGPREFNRPEGVCVDAQDRIYVADSCNHRIQVFQATGEFIRAYGKPGTGPGELSYPYDICVDPEGRQYVCEFGNSRIQVFDAEGRSVEIIGGPGAAPARFSNPWGVALDSAGNLYVADSQNHRIQKLVRRPGSFKLAAKPANQQVEPGKSRP